jgi:hypothetical protein
LLVPSLLPCTYANPLRFPWRDKGTKLRVVLGLSATYLLVFHSPLSSESSYSVLSRRKRLAARSAMVDISADLRISKEDATNYTPRR